MQARVRTSRAVTTKWIAIARAWVPKRVRYLLQRYISVSAVKQQWLADITPNSNVSHSDVNNRGIPFRFGIARNSMQYHCSYVTACLEMGVPFTVIDLAAADWMEQVRMSRCDVLLVWPDGFLTIWNSMNKERIEILERELGTTVFPTTKEIWFYEDKRRTAYWLSANEIPHPRTWVFYDLEECHQFVSSCDLPIMYKASFGAAASGVRLFDDRRALKRFVSRVFQKGHLPGGFDRRDRQWGSVLLQEYLPGVKEWRMVRIGDSYFGHGKGSLDGIHSGSGLVEWDVPEDRHLDFLYEITEKGGFRSMDVDVFETEDGRLLVNELQALFGASHSVDQLRKDGVPGRFVRTTQEPREWVFEAGDFARNACANERIRYIISNRHSLSPREASS